MRTFPLALLSTLLLAACDAAGPGNDGPLALGIIAGNHQVVGAGAERLPQPVVGKMVRQPGGGITFRLVTPAYAQGTVVNGSPVPGAVVCAVSTEGQLEAFTPCTNTDEAGQATFFFAPGTKAGEARAEIRGTLEGEPAVFDTVVAIVEPGATVRFWSVPEAYNSETDVLAADTFDLRETIGGVDEYGNETDGSDLAALDGSLVHWRWTDGVKGGQRPCEPVPVEGSGWIVTVPDFEAACFGSTVGGAVSGHKSWFEWTIDGYDHTHGLWVIQP